MSLNNTLKNILGDTNFLKLQKVKKIIFPTKFDKEQKAYFNTQVDFYMQLIKPNSLCFDIGANIGLKSKIFLQLGAKVIAVEPQVSCVEILKKELEGKAIIIPKGVGAKNELKDFYVSNNMELSSFNINWVNALPGQAFGDTSIKQIEKIEIITLDDLIEEYGVPNFIKIDVEGYEAEVLKGLSRAFKLLSFEFYVENDTSQLLQCLDVLESKYEVLLVNFAIGNQVTQFHLQNWLSINEFKYYVNTTNFKSMFAGDIYVKMLNSN